QLLSSPLSELPAPSTQLHHLALSADDVLKKLMNLDTSNAAGIDNLHPTIIKSCAGPVLATITSLYSSCLMYHTMPMQWKIHKICPVYKSGDRSNVCNFRLITQLCILSEMLESLVYDKIIQFICSKLSKNQFGFLRQRSCQNQLLSFFADIYSGIRPGVGGCPVLRFQEDISYSATPGIALQAMVDWYHLSDCGCGSSATRQIGYISLALMFGVSFVIVHKYGVLCSSKT
uniref:Reverse transcriptase domain-containing protein n=1 Tax=Amphimedon queenslandica TaxID=400682 RepID=A0A1X7UC72_AMPQE